MLFTVCMLGILCGVHSILGILCGVYSMLGILCGVYCKYVGNIVIS